MGLTVHLIKLLWLASVCNATQFLVDRITPVWSEIISGVTPAQLKKEPLQAYVHATYGNLTSDGWQVYAHGYLYKKIPMTDTKVLKLLNKPLLLSWTDVDHLRPDQVARGQETIRELVVHKEKDLAVWMDVDVCRGSECRNASIPLKTHTSKGGSFHEMMPLPKYLPLNPASQDIQQIELQVSNVAHSSRAAAYLVPPTGLTFVSDIDDILRMTKIWRPADSIFDLLVNDYTPWSNMPSIYATWASRWPQAHFHYLTTTFESLTHRYFKFLQRHYPPGSLDTRQMDNVQDARRKNLKKILETFPERKFVLVGDTTNEDALEWYPKFAREFGDRVSCILIRDTAATEPTDRIHYKLNEFEKLPTERYFFFTHPDDLLGVDFMAGQCGNNSMAQRLDFKGHRCGRFCTVWDSGKTRIKCLMPWWKNKPECKDDGLGSGQ